MRHRVPASLLLMALLTGLAQSQSRAVLDPPVDAGLKVGPPIIVTPPARTWLDTGVTQAQGQTGIAPAVVDLPVAPSPSASRIWIDAEVLLWWMKSANLPPLVTASPPGTAAANVGVLGVPGTVVLFGGSGVNGDLTVGGRLTAGRWLDDEQTRGIEAYYFQLGVRAERARAGTPDNVGRPFIDAGTGLPDAQFVSVPGFLDGAVRVSASSGSLLGAGVLARTNVWDGFRIRLDTLVGYRFLSLNDRVGITENLTSSDPTQAAAPLGTNILVADHFRAANRFHGADFGLACAMRRDAWSLGATVRVALGASHEWVDIDGATTVTVPGFAPVVNSGGLLALSSNSGTHTRNIFAVVPEVRFQLAYQLTPRTRVHGGYSLLYWSHVARAGDQIDVVVNPALLPPPVPGATPLRPAFTFQGTGFWAQGIDLGLEFRF